MGQVKNKQGRFRGPWMIVTIGFPLAGVILSIYQIFHIRIFDFMMMGNSYLYALLALFLPLNFLYFPLLKKRPRLSLAIDSSFALMTSVICMYFAYNGFDITYEGFGFRAPTHYMIMALILWGLVIESVRRCSGPSLTAMIVLFSLYPIYASFMPGFLEGYGRSFTATVTFHALGSDSIIGIPLRVAGNLMIGFLIFGIALQISGGGEFFLNLSTSLLGKTRGGTAKVAVMSSALFGSMSGSPVSNVITTGSITIPAMVKTGYPPHYAGGIECVASSGGSLMPPIMGATAFVMASFLGMPYYDIALAAAIPSFLVYLGLLVQVDGYAGRLRFSGLAKSEIPSLWVTFKRGWFYLLVLLILLYMLFMIRLESQAPFYAMLGLFFFAAFNRSTRITLPRFLELIEKTGRFLSQLVAQLAGVGMIIGALALTGVAVSFSRELLALAGDSIMGMVILGALASFVLGMGMTITACYVFLALVLAPGLVEAGLNEVGVHLFIMYWGMLSYITPPVALAAFPAATIANTSQLKVAGAAMKLGAIKYIVPFLFILNPALVFQGNGWEVSQAFATATVGVLMIGSVLENYMIGVGNLQMKTWLGKLLGGVILVSGLLISLPGTQTDIYGLAFGALCIGASILNNRRLEGSELQLNG